jgi:nucleoid-associated protein YgaU
MPGMVPPVALGAIALFVTAALLFLMPGFFAGGAPTPPPSIAVPTEAPRSLEPNATPAPLQSIVPTPSMRAYVVTGGDTLIDIARKFAVTQEQLICANKELRRNPDLLTVGQELQVPSQDWVCPKVTRTAKP